MPTHIRDQRAGRLPIVAVWTLIAIAIASPTLPGCGDKSTDGGSDAKQVAAPTDPGVMLVVNGVEIRREEIEKAVDYFSRVFPEEPREKMIGYAINEDLVPLAAVKAHYANRLNAKRAEIENLHCKVLEGEEDVRTLAKQFRFEDATYRDVKESWHKPDQFKHSGQGIAAFDTPKGEVSDVFVSSGGVHFVHVVDRTSLGELRDHRAKLYQIVVQFDTVENLTRTVPQVRDSTSVEWVHPDYENYVHASFRNFLGR